VRHPAYPNSVCGVVYQGASLATGCQFTFTCDGALRWKPEPDLWRRAVHVARQALAGFVDRDVGSATHYHAVYVAPYWAPKLVKMTRIGQHIFYRWGGAWGEPPAFTGRYSGHEADLSDAVLARGDPAMLSEPPLRRVTLAAAGGGLRSYKVADPGASAEARTPRPDGVLYASRRQPTRAEVQKINASLAALESRLDAPASAAAAEQAGADVAARSVPDRPAGG
jgi:hypothetical protein